VKEGNHVWCCGHRIELVVGDALDDTKAHPPAATAAHRSLLKKARALVILINNHRDTYNQFHRLALAKLDSEEGQRNFTELVMDNDTRWNLDLKVLEHLVYFDVEILQLYAIRSLGIPADAVFTQDELDLARGMTLVLKPVRSFSLFVQKHNEITLAYVPRKIDELVTALAPGAFVGQLEGVPAPIIQNVEALQSQLIISIKSRFADVFVGDSLALAAAYMLPGPRGIRFDNFTVTEQIENDVKTNIIDDVIFLMKEENDANDANMREIVSSTLAIARRKLSELPVATNPRRWWPSQQLLSILFPVTGMLFGAQASSADNERAFSSAGFVLNYRRTRLDPEWFRKEHRVRRYLQSGLDLQTHEGREAIVERMNGVISEYILILEEFERDGAQ
jgi:hypothetical protein